METTQIIKEVENLMIGYKDLKNNFVTSTLELAKETEILKQMEMKIRQEIATALDTNGKPLYSNQEKRDAAFYDEAVLKPVYNAQKKKVDDLKDLNISQMSNIDVYKFKLDCLKILNNLSRVD